MAQIIIQQLSERIEDWHGDYFFEVNERLMEFYEYLIRATTKDDEDAEDAEDVEDAEDAEDVEDGQYYFQVVWEIRTLRNSLGPTFSDLRKLVFMLEFDNRKVTAERIDDIGREICQLSEIFVDRVEYFLEHYCSGPDFDPNAEGFCEYDDSIGPSDQESHFAYAPKITSLICSLLNELSNLDLVWQPPIEADHKGDQSTVDNTVSQQGTGSNNKKSPRKKKTKKKENEEKKYKPWPSPGDACFIINDNEQIEFHYDGNRKNLSIKNETNVSLFIRWLTVPISGKIINSALCKGTTRPSDIKKQANKMLNDKIKNVSIQGVPSNIEFFRCYPEKGEDIYECVIPVVTENEFSKLEFAQPK